MRKKILLSIISFASIVIFTFVLEEILFGGLLPDFTTVHQIEAEFSNNREKFDHIVDFMVQEKKVVYITKTGWRRYSIEGEPVEPPSHFQNISIKNEGLDSDIKFVTTSLDYAYISEDNNGIYFMNDSGSGPGKGVVHSTDGKKPAYSGRYIKDSLGNGWYYYEGE